MSDETIETTAAKARAELEETLHAIERKLNVPKRVNDLADKARDSYTANPVPWIVAATAAAAAVIGLVAWAILSDD